MMLAIYMRQIRIDPSAERPAAGERRPTPTHGRAPLSGPSPQFPLGPPSAVLGRPRAMTEDREGRCLVGTGHAFLFDRLGRLGAAGGDGCVAARSDDVGSCDRFGWRDTDHETAIRR